MQNIHHKNKRLLVVDDEVTFRMLMYEILTGASFLVDLAEDGKKAFQKIRNNSYNLIISDINMYGMDGKNLYYKTIKDFPKFKNRFLFLTGRPTDEIISFFKENSFDYLIKPFRILELLNKVTSVLNREEGVPANTRCEERFPWSVDCEIIDNQKPLIAKIEDASKNGARIRYSGDPFIPGSTIKINIINLNTQVSAKIIWSKPIDTKENQAGLRVAQPLQIPLHITQKKPV